MLRWLLGLAVLCEWSIFAQSYGQSSLLAVLPNHLEVRSVAKNTFVVIDLNYYPSNILVAQMPGDTVLIVSSPFESRATKSLIDWVMRSLKPNKTVAVNPHFHLDGTGGNEIYKKAGAEVWSSDLTMKLQTKLGRELVQKVAAAYKGDLKQLIENTKIVVADHTFDIHKGKKFRFEDETVEVFFPGEAHSPDNVVIYFPKRKILFGGCMIKPKDLGYLGDANVNAWVESARKLKKFDTDLVVPGHGPWGGPTLIDETIKVAKAAHAQLDAK